MVEGVKRVLHNYINCSATTNGDIIMARLLRNYINRLYNIRKLSYNYGTLLTGKSQSQSQ